MDEEGDTGIGGKVESLLGAGVCSHYDNRTGDGAGARDTVGWKGVRSCWEVGIIHERDLGELAGSLKGAVAARRVIYVRPEPVGGGEMKLRRDSA